jgi:hypothetical protein
MVQYPQFGGGPRSRRLRLAASLSEQYALSLSKGCSTQFSPECFYTKAKRMSNYHLQFNQLPYEI